MSVDDSKILVEKLNMVFLLDAMATGTVLCFILKFSQENHLDVVAAFRKPPLTLKNVPEAACDLVNFSESRLLHIAR